MRTAFQYCENPDAEVPKMFIDTHIGDSVDEKGNVTKGIDGSLFRKELYCLSDEMGKKKIEVWINCEGGSVKGGMDIYTGMLDCTAEVDTVCYGIAASMGGVIFQAGAKKKMFDHAWLMYHNPYNPDGNNKDEGLEMMRNSICVMVAKRTGKSEDEIAKVLNKETFITSTEAYDNGFCDEVLQSDEKNNKRMLAAVTMNAKWEAANKIQNRANNENPVKMNYKTITAKLELVDEANETAILNAIDRIQNKSKEDLAKMKADYDDAMKTCNDLKKKIADMEDVATAAAQAKAATDAAARAVAELEIENKAAAQITAAVGAGKIKNDATLIETYKNMYKKNPTETQAILDAMTVTKASASFDASKEVKLEDNEFETVARMNGQKPGTAGWYNAIKVAQMNKADETAKIK